MCTPFTLIKKSQFDELLPMQKIKQLLTLWALSAKKNTENFV